MSELREVTIHDLARGGSGVGKHISGEVIFVPFSAPGDELVVQITKSKKNYSEGEITQVVRPSDLRVPAPCPVFEKCGGCSWQHLPYSLQFETKKKGLFQALKRANVETDGISFDECPAEETYHYRNRIQLHGNPAQKAIGFYGRGTNEIVPIQECPITDARINQEIPRLAELGFSKFKEPFKLEIEVRSKGQIRHIFNEPHGALGFRQVNDAQNAKLQNWVKTNITPGDLLLDLYGGSGNLSIPLLDLFSEIRCIDAHVPGPDASKAPHFTFLKKDVRGWSRAPHVRPDHHKQTSVILDPPREGLGAIFSEIESKISKFETQCVLLIGCDVDSFARDTSHFIQKGYQLKRLGVLDLFPQTPHVESLALFHK